MFKSPLDAIKYAFENNYQYLLGLVEDLNIWRINRYYFEHVDNFIQAHLPLFVALFKTWATKKEIGKKE